MSWTRPGQGYTLQEAVKINNKPDNPRDRVGDAVNRTIEYAYIYVDGLENDKGKQLVSEFSDLINGKTNVQPFKKFLVRFNPHIWDKIGKNRKDCVLKGKTVVITNSKLGNLGSSQSDIMLLSRKLGEWCELNDAPDAKIGSVLNSQR